MIILKDFVGNFIGLVLFVSYGFLACSVTSVLIHHRRKYNGIKIMKSGRKHDSVDDHDYDDDVGVGGRSTQQ